MRKGIFHLVGPPGRMAIYTMASFHYNYQNDLRILSYFVRHKTIGDNVCAEYDFLLLKLQNSNPYRCILDWKTKKTKYMIPIRDNLNKEIHVPSRDIENSGKAKGQIFIPS